MIPAQHIQARLAQLRDTVPEDVTIVVTTKYLPAEALPALFEAGVRDFGESRIQEALAKQVALPPEMTAAIRWHFIGHLQQNKVNKTPGVFHLLQSVDSVALIHKLAEANRQAQTMQPLLLQLNLTAEAQKHGLSLSELDEAVTACVAASDVLTFSGLMCFASPIIEQADARRCEAVFAQLNETAAELETRFGLKNLHRSMGMSQDYAHALKNGATIIRIGRLLLDGLH